MWKMGMTLRMYFYPRPPRGGRLFYNNILSFWQVFLSTPSARRATKLVDIARTATKFLSTPSARRATRRLSAPTAWRCHFYPRPPRGGRPQQCGGHQGQPYFYPRPPRGGRQLEADPQAAALLFLSTPSARRATYLLFYWVRYFHISIHALREEGDG